MGLRSGLCSGYSSSSTSLLMNTVFLETVLFLAETALDPVKQKFYISIYTDSKNFIFIFYEFMAAVLE